MDSALASVLQGSNRAVEMRPIRSFEFIHVITRTKIGLSIVTMLCVLVISLAAEPPFLTVRDEDPIQAEKLSYPRTAVVTAAAGSFFYLLPKFAK